MLHSKITAIIVTYSDRFHLLRQVIDATLKAGVGNIVVVDNASVDFSRDQLKAYEVTQPNLKVLYLSENLGSAGGYKKALEFVFQDQNCESIWFLDDDNVPQEDALLKLLQAQDYIKQNNKDNDFALASFRYGFGESHKKNFFLAEQALGLGVIPSAFMHFDCINAIKTRLIKTFYNTKNKGRVYPLFPIDKAPYGGFFCAKTILERMGYPNEEYFVYADDTEYTNRLVRNGGQIYYCTFSKIQEIHATYNKSVVPLIFCPNSQQRAYYNVRNLAHFSKMHIRSQTRYFFNLFIYFFGNMLLGLRRPSGFFKGVKLLVSAICDGYKGRLGKR